MSLELPFQQQCSAQDVKDRRALVRRYNEDPAYKKMVDEDKRARAKAERAADPPVSLFDIILPLAPFGIPGALCTSRVPMRRAGWCMGPSHDLTCCCKLVLAYSLLQL